MSNFIKKYKDKSPQETIQNIKLFFNNKKVQIIEKNIIQSCESNTWSCIIQLVLDNIIILQTCGKGVTKDYALASGYAELYERFCNRTLITLNPIVNFLTLKENFIKNQYFISKNESIISVEDFMQESSLIAQMLFRLFKNEENIKSFLNFYCNGVIIKSKYLNCFNDKDEYYMDSRLQQKFMTSSGMVAGNSLEEAKIQGISEIFEHYVQQEFFKNPPKTLYEIKKFNQYNQNIIDQIQKNNKIVRIFDLSYNYQVPVCLILLLDIENYNYSLDFAAAPTFNIAVERCLTEIYQNVNYHNKVALQIPNTNFQWYEILFHNTSCIIDSNSLNEQILNNIKETQYNTEYYLEDKDNNNSNFLKHYEFICHKKGMELYYLNNSQDSNIFALQIISPNFIYKDYVINYFNSLTQQEITLVLNDIEKIYNNLIETLIFNKKHNFTILMPKNKKIEEFYLFLFGTNWFDLFNKRDNIINIINISNELNELTYLQLQHTKYHKLIKKYLTLKKYKQQNYSNDEIYNIFSLIDKILTKDDIDQSLNNKFLFEKIVINPLLASYKSDTFQKFIQLYCQ